MSKYVLEFEKKELMIYISHLDLLRLFKRAFKRTGIEIRYSQGFNPHPIMSFAQPLSLGYTGLHEFVEFETQKDYDVNEILTSIKTSMPGGINILDCRRYNGNKTLAAITDACRYEVVIPVKDLDVDGYLMQEEIIVPKKMKKSKKFKDIDIKDKIRDIKKVKGDGSVTLMLHLDGGSISNLSPELVIKSLLKYNETDVERSKIKVIRNEIILIEQQ